MASLLSNEKYSLYFQKVGLIYKRPEIRASVEVLLSVFTIIILGFAAIRPTLTNITALQKKIADQEIVNKKADNKIAQLFNAQNQLNTLGNGLNLFNAAVPDNYSYSDSTKRMEYLVRKNNLSIESLSLSGYTLLAGGKATNEWIGKIALPSADNILTDQITFAISGKPQNIINFLREIENMDRLAVLFNVSLNKQVGVSKAEDNLKASGVLTFYFYPVNQ
jgi:hypothetical protein